MRAWVAILGLSGSSSAMWRQRVVSQFDGVSVQRFACHDDVRTVSNARIETLLMQIDYQAQGATAGQSRSIDHAAMQALSADGSATFLSHRDADGTRWWPLLRPLAYVGWWREAGAALRSSFRDDPIGETAFSAPLVGEFNFCGIRDGSLTLRADHYATQPCYYLPLDSGWLAVSDIRLAYGLVPARFCIKERALEQLLSADRLVAENDDSDGGTCFQAVWKVRPGETVVLRRDHGPCRRNAVHIDAALDRRGEDVLLDPREATRAFSTCFNACVADRIAAGAGGVLLSGGLDSSSVYAASHLASSDTKMHGVCLSFSDPDLALSQDERIVSEMVAALQGTCDILHVDADLRIAMPEDRGMHLDGPDLCANVLSKAAAAQSFLKQGRDFVMTGEGGDLILGEVYYAWLGDAVFRAEGGGALDRYLTRGRGLRRGEPRYLLEWSAALSSRWTGWRATRAFDAAIAMPLPPYLRQNTNGAASAGGAEGEQASRWFSWATRHRRVRTGMSACGAHRLLDAMLFPRAAYFDAIGTHLFHSHPFLDPRMVALTRRIPAHCHYDIARLQPHLEYGCAKQLARNAYRHVLPDSAVNKQEKTSYALMARKLFANSAGGARAMLSDGMLLADRGLVDASVFRRYFNAYAIVSADPNADLGMGFHYLRAVLDTEVWLRQFTADRAAADSRAGWQNESGNPAVRTFALASVMGVPRKGSLPSQQAKDAVASIFPANSVVGRST